MLRVVTRLAAVTLVGALLALVGCGGGDPATDLAARAPGGWQRLPDSPLAARTGAVGVWTGTEVIVVGGSTFLCPPTAGCSAPDEPPFSDGAALDPDAGSWRAIADAPVPIGSASTAVLGDDVFLLASAGWAGETAMLRYEVAEDRWTQLALPGDGSAWYALVAAGDVVVAYATSHERGAGADFVLDPDGGWEELAADPLGPAFDRTMVWAAPHLYLFDHELVPNPGSERPSLTRAARLDVAGARWERLPDSEILGSGPWLVEPDTMTTPLLGGADGGEVNGWGRTYPYGGTLELDTPTWAPLPDGPADTRVAGAFGPTAALFVDTRGQLLDVANGTWREMEAIPGDEASDRLVVTAGRAAVAYGGSTWVGTGGELLGDAWIWRLG